MTTKEQIQNYLLAADLHRARDFTVAEALGLSPSTMRRRLREEGTGFAALCTAEKQRRCKELLDKNPRADGWAIADTCGYAEQNAATRAFRQWFGCTLRGYKIGLRGVV